MKARTLKFGSDIIQFCGSLENTKASSVISYQIIKSATSVGANYRAACRARSGKEFYSKLCIVVEESDETDYWLELIKETKLSSDESELTRLIQESLEITKIMSKARSSVGNN